MIVLAASVIAMPALAATSTADPACLQPLLPGAEHRAAATGASFRTLGQRRAPALADRKPPPAPSSAQRPGTKRVTDADRLPHEVAEPALAAGKSSEANGVQRCLTAWWQTPATGVHSPQQQARLAYRNGSSLAWRMTKAGNRLSRAQLGRFRGNAGEPDVQITRRKKGGFT